MYKTHLQKADFNLQLQHIVSEVNSPYQNLEVKYSELLFYFDFLQ